MLPDKQVVDWDVGNLWFSSVRSQQSQPVLCGDDIVWVDGVLSQFQSIKELLKFCRRQGVNVLSYHRGFPQVAVWSSPAKFTLSAVMPSKVPWTTESTQCELCWSIEGLLSHKDNTCVKLIMTHRYICRSDWKTWWATSLCHQHFSDCMVLPTACCRLEWLRSFLSLSESRRH